MVRTGTSVNYAILNRVRLVSGASDQLIRQIKQATRQLQLKNMAEIVFYRSPDNPEEFYVISYWFQLQTNQQAKPAEFEFFKHLLNKGELVDRETFQLCWEYRLITRSPATSHIRLLTFPEDFPEDRTQEIINFPRKHRLEVPGVIGSWMGLSLENKRKTLHRVDWATVEDRINFFNKQGTQEILEERKRSGIQIEYASFDLHELIEHAPGSLQDNVAYPKPVQRIF